MNDFFMLTSKKFYQNCEFNKNYVFYTNFYEKQFERIYKPIVDEINNKYKKEVLVIEQTASDIIGNPLPNYYSLWCFIGYNLQDIIYEKYLIGLRIEEDFHKYNIQLNEFISE